MSSGVEFEEDKFMSGRPSTPSSSAGNSNSHLPNLGYGRPIPPPNTPKMSQWLMKHGIKSEHSAQVILIGIIIFNIVVTFIMVKFFI
jgi:hypothetical protein